MYSFAEDSTGELSLFFRIILSDPASVPSRLRDVTERVRDEIRRQTEAEELGLQTYFNFRSQSEQAAIGEPWER